MNVPANEVLKKWMDEHGDVMFSYTAARIKDADAVEDILQETFISAWKGFNNFSGKASEKTWLFSILKNKIIDYYRKQGRRPEFPASPELLFDDKGHWTTAAAPSPWKGADELVNRKDFQTIFSACISALSEKLREAFLLRYVEEKEGEEICKELDITSSNYWVMMHRSKLLLRACLEKKWFNIPKKQDDKL